MSVKLTLRLLIAINLVIISLGAFAQKPPEKYGKIEKDELLDNICPIDSSAHAWFIFDYGNSYFRYADTEIRSTELTRRKGFQLYHTRHFRIKIAGNQGFTWADIKIPLYRDVDKEEITRLKAVTYNFQDGKIVRTNLKRNDVFEEETSENWITCKFAMPDVREGSVIEVEYTVKSDFFFNLQPWYFQSTIPVLFSEYHVSIPEYFAFNHTQKGYFPFKTTNETKMSQIKINYHQEGEGLVRKAETYTSTYDFKENVHHYEANNIPAFPDEEFLRSKENYLTKIEFELQSTMFPNSTLNSYTTNWETINKNLLESDGFGKELGRASHLEKDAGILKQLHQTKSALLKGAFDYMKQRMSWNEIKNKYVSSKLNKVYEERTGNSADINLNLVALLRELEFDAHPVILSTQEHGIIYPSHPSVSRFNYVIAMVRLDGDTLLMDATDPVSEINLLPVRCLNDKGRIVNGNGGSWIRLMDYRAWNSIENYFIGIDQNLEVTGKYQSLLKDYAKYQFKSTLKATKQEDYEANTETTSEIVIEDLTITGLDSLNSDIGVSYSYSTNSYLEKANDLVFFKPLFRPFVTKNPFRLEKREFPVEYNYPLDVKQVYSISIPENYSIQEIPQPLNVRTPDGKLRYLYSVKQLGNTLFVSMAFSLDRTLFLPQEYDVLKKIYQMIVDKQNESIVLKNKG